MRRFCVTEHVSCVPHNPISRPHDAHTPTIYSHTQHFLPSPRRAQPCEHSDAPRCHDDWERCQRLPSHAHSHPINQRGGDSHTLYVDLGCSDLLAKQQHQLLRCWQYVDFKRELLRGSVVE